MQSDLHNGLEASAIYPAHIRISDDGPVIQTVQEHCQEAAAFAQETLSGVGLGTTAHLAGLFHDLGKLTGAYRNYIVDIAEDRPVIRGSVNHTFAGVRFVLDHLLTSDSGPMARVAAEHIAYAIGAHHGLFDGVDAGGAHGFDWRRFKEDPTIQEGVARYLESCNTAKLRGQLTEAGQEISRFYSRFSNRRERFFYSHLVSRLILSAVMEGDRRSTAQFANPNMPRPSPPDPHLWESCLSHLEKKLHDFPQDTAVQRGRGTFSELCRDFAEKPPGIYRLNMPTGAGKTISSLRYALAHGKKWNKKRIFFVMPLLAIIDQNAQVIREYLGQDDILLEHHSNILPSNESGELDSRELLMENWDAPVVITTLVQLLNTLFSHKTASIRRFHSLCNSIIVLDEVQTVPTKMLSLFNQAIAFLSEACGATVILCSATQPALEYAQRPLSKVPQDIIPFNQRLWEPFCRTIIHPTSNMRLEEIASFASILLQEKSSLLIICNQKSQAAQLYEWLQNQEASCFHLSASMCMAHRRETLSVMEEAKKHQKVLCVSTQIMEAGIDTSFQCVIRLTAGMDSVIQAAGRCNRDGKSPSPEMVYVIPCLDERLNKLPEIRDGKEASRTLFAIPMDDYSSVEAIQGYYHIFYREQKDGFQDYYVEALGKTLYDLLSSNSFVRESSYFLNQAYKTACTHFQVFDNDTVDVVVPYKSGASWIQALRQSSDDLARCLQELKPYTISLYQYQREKLEKMGALTVATGGILVLHEDWYNDTLGLLFHREELAFLEV